MTDDDICDLAVNFDAMSGEVGDLIKFARAIESRAMINQKARWYQEGVEAEREACAKVCEQIDAQYFNESVVAAVCANGIRARGK